MMDPIELEQKATERLKDIGLYLLGWLFGLLALLFVAGLFGLVIGFAIRIAKWVMAL